VFVARNNLTITKQQVEQLLHGNPDIDEWSSAMSLLFPKYEINTPARIAGFVAQCGHESQNFKTLEENLNYSAEGLNKIFLKYFVKAGRDAQAYHRQPEKIANIVYAGRMGNGDTASGEGWKFRGRGVIQLTGKDNYSRFAKHVGKSIDETIEYLKTKQGALESACWFWETNGLNEIADSGDIVAMTKRINGGTIGLDDRKKHYEHALAVLGGKAVHAHASSSHATLKRGDNSPAVAKMQRALGISADGDFGPGTETALKRWQAANGLTADGVAGPKTLSKLLG
jgi:putative chitinase